MALVVLLMTVLTAPAFAKDWTEFGGSPERLRYSTEDMGPPVYLAWTHQAGASMSQPVVVGDRIYHLGGDKLWVYDAKADGQYEVVKEVRNGGTPSHSDPTYANGGVYYGTGANKKGVFSLAFYDPETKDPVYVNLSSEIVTAPLVLDGDITVVATCDGKIYAVRGLSSGAGKRKSFQVGTGRITSSAGRLSGDSFVMGFDADRRVAAFRVGVDQSGGPMLAKLWEFKTTSGVPASISVDGDRIYFSDKAAHFYCLDRSGNLVWKNSDFSGGFINDSPAVSPTGVFFSIRDYKGKGRLVRVDKATGKSVWSAGLEAKGANSPIIWARAGAVVAGDTNGKMYVFNGANGDPYPAFLKDGKVSPTYQMTGAEIGPGYSRFSGSGAQIALSSGSMDEGVLLGGANVSETEGALYCWRLSRPVDLGLENARLDNEEGTKASVDARFLLGKDPLDTDISWEIISFDKPLSDLAAMTPEQLLQLLPNKAEISGFAPGETRVFTVDVPPESAGKVVFAINPSRQKPLGELDWGNNFAEVKLPTRCTDISVVNPYYKSGSNIYTGMKFELGAYVKRDNQGPDGPVPVKVVFTGPDGSSHTTTVNLSKGETKRVSITPTVYRPGTATFTITAEPVGVEDCAPGNNRARISVNVQQDPSMPIPDSKIWVALVSSR
jgi:hypothetical protein